MYICEKCGELIDEDELKTGDEYEEVWGSFMSRTVVDCECSCGGQLVEAKFCLCCKNYVKPDSDLSSTMLDEFDDIPDDYKQKNFPKHLINAHARHLCDDCISDFLYSYKNEA